MADRERDDALADDGRDETVTERADRNFSELLQELRVAQTGVQILFAFLLTLPFTQRFEHISNDKVAVYLTTLSCTALATVFLIAPVSHHRVVFARRRKPQLVRDSGRMAKIGLVFLWLSIVGAMFLIFDVVVGTVVAVVVGVLLA